LKGSSQAMLLPLREEQTKQLMVPKHPEKSKIDHFMKKFSEGKLNECVFCEESGETETMKLGITIS